MKKQQPKQPKQPKHNAETKTVTMDKIVKAQIKMFRDSVFIDDLAKTKRAGFVPRQKSINKVVRQVSKYVKKLNIPESDQDDMLEILGNFFLMEVMEQLRTDSSAMRESLSKDAKTNA